MRVAVYLAACGMVFAQTPDPAYAPLARAYDALRARDYESALSNFRSAIDAAPDRVAIRKDLAYTYLKTGENDLAREQFHEAMRLDPDDVQVALEYAFLSYESKHQAEARRIFDRLRQAGNPTAEEAFRNVDEPLASGIERWRKALEAAGGSFSGHYELASLAEQRDELELAAEHYRQAWSIQPDRRYVLVDLGRVWKSLGLEDDATAALLAASRGGEARAAEMAREFLPDRYPYVDEFRRALELDPANVELRRELAYLLLRMDRQPEAEVEFEFLAPRDLLAATQLGFLLQGRGERAQAQPWFDRVLAGDDEDLANRVRAVLRMPQMLKPRAAARPESIDAKVMAERSIKAGYMKDAVRYLQAAHESDPGDFDIMLKLGWANNILRQDRRAFEWFGLARRSPDPRIASEASRAWSTLRLDNERIRVSGWFYPMYSTRWKTGFSYAQAKVEMRTGWPVRFYGSARLAGDSGFLTTNSLTTESLSEQSLIIAIGATTSTWRGVRAWFEAGNAVGYVNRHMRPDYRGGLAFSRPWSRFADTSVDAIYVSRFNKDFIVYNQNRIGRLSGPLQLYWNGNLTFDARREHWANFVETGPGFRALLSPSSFFTLNLLRGAYLIVRPFDLRRETFTDLRAGLWYAFSR